MNLGRANLWIAVTAVAFGFSLLSLPFVEHFFDSIASTLATISRAVLELFGYDIIQSGVILRDKIQGFAIEVTEACDGHGLLICWIAILVAVPGSIRSRFLYFLAGFLIIQIFNLVRVILLFILAPKGVAIFDGFHYFIFPLLTCLLMISMSLLLVPRLLPSAGFVSLLLLGLAAAWYVISEPVSVALLVPPAEGMNTILGYSEVGQVTKTENGWKLGSNLVQSLEPLRLYIAPFYPADFSLATPALISAVLVARCGYVLLLVCIIGMVAALSIGYHTTIWSIAVSNNVEFGIVNLGGDAAALVEYEKPSELLIAAFRLLQNVIVHSLLLVFPSLILIRGVDRAETMDAISGS